MSPWAVARPCAFPGCASMQPCPIHGKRRHTRSVRFGESNTKERGYGWDWQKLRTILIGERPVCERCGQSPTKELHHIVPIADAPHLRLEPANIRALCKKCHAAAHVQIDTDKRRTRAERTPAPPLPRDGAEPFTTGRGDSHTQQHAPDYSKNRRHHE